MKSDPRGCEYAESGVKKTLQTWERKHSAKAVMAKHSLTFGYVNMAEKKVQCERQVVAMFWDFGSAVSSQQQSAGDPLQTATSSNRSSGSKRAQETNEVFTGDTEKFLGDCSGCQRDFSTLL